MFEEFLIAFGNSFNFFPNTDYGTLIKPQEPFPPFQWTTMSLPAGHKNDKRNKDRRLAKIRSTARCNYVL